MSKADIVPAVTDAIANFLEDRVVPGSDFYLEGPHFEHMGYGEELTFTVLGGGLRNPVQVSVTIELT